MKRSVLFICTGNSCRSQMAEGFLRHLAGDQFEVSSAGTDPVPVNPGAVAAMADAGIDISTQQSKEIRQFLGRHFTYVITVCDRAAEKCPIFPGTVKRLEWTFPDPASVTGSDAVRAKAFRDVRDQIKSSVDEFIESETAHNG